MASLNIEDLMLINREMKLDGPITVGIIGCGGTGSLFIRDAMRVINVFNKTQQDEKHLPGVNRIFFCDADVVEEKNLIRQNFIPQDIGRNKAEVLAERYGSAFGLDIDIIPEYIEDEKKLYNICMNGRPTYQTYHSTVILFSMVDNVKTRLMMSNFMNGYVDNIGFTSRPLPFDVIIVDCGNSEYAGQVCVSSLNTSVDRFYLPTVAQVQPDLMDKENWDKFASELSCEENAVSDPQSIAANSTAANIAMNVLFNLMFKGRIHFSKVVFNAANNTSVTTFLRRGDNKQTCTIGRIKYED